MALSYYCRVNTEQLNVLLAIAETLHFVPLAVLIKYNALVSLPLPSLVEGKVEIGGTYCLNTCIQEDLWLLAKL